MYCTKCGKEAGRSDKFCTDCGLKIGTSDGEVKKLLVSDTAANTQQKESSNSLSNFALGLGIASAFFFEFVFIPIAAVVVSAISLSKASELTRANVEKTGKGKSIAGLILGIVYSLLGFYYLTLW